MYIELADSNRLIEFRPENRSDTIFLTDFPGFLRPRGSGRFLLPKSIPILKNVVKRIKARRKQPINVSKEIYEMMQQEVKLLDLPPDFEMYTQPFPHQELALRYMYTFGAGGLLLDPGLGKTKVVLDLIALMKFKKSLIICPKALLFVWEDETAIHRRDKSVYVLQSTSWAMQIDSARKRVIKWEVEMDGLPEGSDEWKRARQNYMSARRQVEKLPEAMAEDIRRAQEADIVVVNYDKVANGINFLMKNFQFDFVAADEGLIKDPKTNRTKAVTTLGSKVPYRCIMSGTLINNTPMDCYAPIRFLQPALVSTSYSRFETYYGHMVQMKNSNRRFLAGVSKKSETEIKEILDACCIVMDKNEWLDLPEKKFIVHNAPLSEEQHRVQEELIANYISDVTPDLQVEADGPLTVMSKLYQVANGFVYHYDKKQDDEDLYKLLAVGDQNGNEQQRLEGYSSGTEWMESFFGGISGGAGLEGHQGRSRTSEPGPGRPDARTSRSPHEAVNGYTGGEEGRSDRRIPGGPSQSGCQRGPSIEDRTSGSDSGTCTTCTTCGLVRHSGNPCSSSPSDDSPNDRRPGGSRRGSGCSGGDSSGRGYRGSEEHSGTLPGSSAEYGCIRASSQPSGHTPDSRGSEQDSTGRDNSNTRELGDTGFSDCAGEHPCSRGHYGVRGEGRSASEHSHRGSGARIDSDPRGPSQGKPCRSPESDGLSDSSTYVGGSLAASPLSDGRGDTAAHGEGSGTRNLPDSRPGSSYSSSDGSRCGSHPEDSDSSRGSRSTYFFPQGGGKREALRDLIRSSCGGHLPSPSCLHRRGLRRRYLGTTGDPSGPGNVEADEGLLQNRRCIIWYNLSAELELIVGTLEECGYGSDSWSIIRGGTKKTGAIVREFNRDNSKRWLICQAQAVNYGITVLGTDPEKLEKEGVHVLPNIDTSVYTHIFFSLGYSLERFIQQQDRSHRIGLTHSPEYHIILGDCVSEYAIYEALQDKMNIREKFLVDIVHRLRDLT